MNHKRHCFFPELEKRLDEWIIRARNNGTVVTGARILVEAKVIAQDLRLDNFVGSNGWLVNFLKRHLYVLRRINSKNKDLPLNVSTLIQKFHEECRELRQHYVLSQILNADETNIELDSPGDYTYEKKGTKRLLPRQPERIRLSCLSWLLDQHMVTNWSLFL